MKKSRISFLVYACIFVVLALSFIGSAVYGKQQSQTLRTYYYTGDNLTLEQDGYTFVVGVSKDWLDDTLHAETPVGAQYDAVLTNESNYAFKDWSAVITFSDEFSIDSSWNGTFTVDKNVLSFTVANNVDCYRLDSHQTGSFGAVLYSTEILTVQSTSLSGYRMVKMTDLPFFWVSVGLSVVSLFSFLFSVVMRIRIKRFRERQKLDSIIIRQSMSTFTGFIDAKDSYTKGHSVRVAEYASEIYRRMKHSGDEVEQLYCIALMHDCGKIGIPDAVLQKPGKLTAEEYRLIQSHTTLGDALLVNFTAIAHIRDGAHFHHERYDGKGYPTGLKGEDIPLCARIICVADSFDAMSSNRCYRNSLSIKKILSELTENAGKQFDPNIVPYMVNMIEDGFVKKIQVKYPNGTPN